MFCCYIIGRPVVGVMRDILKNELGGEELSKPYGVLNQGSSDRLGEE